MLPRAGRYETVRPIASGGMATVYLGRALGGGGFERAVAIKVLHPHVAAEPEFVAMFLDEARLAAQIHHPNVVATLDLVEDPLFLVMEYIDGPSLYALLRACKKRKQPFPLSIALRIFLDTLAGLHAAHELVGPGGQPLNLVHRDVSPQNVLVGGDGISRITDFGVARAESRISSTRGGALKGKLGYMSPEQVKAQPVDRRSDVYAAGAVLWEMLTGDRLFKADNEAALISQILTGPAYGPRALAAAVPEALDAACMRALASDPEARYPSAAAFAEAVERAVAVSSGVSIASSRAVATLVKGLGLNVLGAEGQTGGGTGAQSQSAGLEPVSTAGPPSTATPNSSPASASSAGVASAVALDSVARRSSMGSLADVLEPQSSTTGVGGVVAEPPPRALVGRPALIAVGVAAALGVAVGAIILTGVGQEPAGADAPVQAVTGVPPDTPGTAAQPAPTDTAPGAADTGTQQPPAAPQPEGTASASTTATASATAPSATASAAPPATTRVVTTPPRTTTRPTGGPKTPPTSPTTFRPKEL